MDILKSYRIPFATIPEGLSEHNFELNNEFFSAMEQDEVLNANVKVHVSIDHKNEVYYCHIIGEGVIGIPCDRCLCPLEHEVNFDEELTVKFGEDFDDSTDGVLVLPDSAVYLDLAPLFCDLTLLTIPMRHIHPAGECDEQMSEILSEHTAEGNFEDDDEDNFED